jgi:hypothetical protein
MNISITVPQLFYDLIARVYPGYLFLFMLKFSLKDIDIGLTISSLTPSTSSVGAIVNFIEYIILCYFAGWILRSFSLYGEDYKISRKNTPEDSAHKQPSLDEMFQRIRLKDEAVGFRIVKLRAEVRMLDAARTGMLIIFLIIYTTFIFQKLSLISGTVQSDGIWILKMLISLVLALAFHRSLNPAMINYIGNVEIHYKILIKENPSTMNEC